MFIWTSSLPKRSQLTVCFCMRPLLETVQFLTNVTKDFEFLKPVGKKQLILTTPAHQKTHFGSTMFN